jgi:hypothetical protein
MRTSWAVVLCLASIGLPSLQSAPPPSKPVEPIAAIVDAFRTHPVVALAEGNHGNEQGHAFRLSLVRDPRFAAVVNDIVVEFGSAQYQDVMDRFVRGEAVTDTTLRQVWQNTTQATTVWDLPIYEEFFRAVRAVNASLARGRQLRVLLGDPPVDWDAVRSRDDLAKLHADMARDRYPADLIRREVVAKNRRALVIYGDGHLQRRDVLGNFEEFDPSAQRVVMRLEAPPAVKVFSIWTETNVDLSTLQPDVTSWRAPALTILRGTTLGAADVTAYLPVEVPRFANILGGPDFSSPLPRDRWRAFSMENQFDALLYLGPPSAITMSRLPVALCKDSAYLNMRLQRLTIAGLTRQVDQLKRFCEP